MSNLNCEFFDEFKKLDNICKDIYGENFENKLGVTLYLDDMDENFSQGLANVSGWKSDYMTLKRIRHIRNELAHSNKSFSDESCSQYDIDFVRNFRVRILNQTDPMALLHKKLNPFQYARLRYPEQNTKTYNKPVNLQYDDYDEDDRPDIAIAIALVLTIIVVFFLFWNF